MNLYEKISKACEFLRPYCQEETRIGIILGSGLGNFVTQIEVIHEIAYQLIPFFPQVTVQGHQGSLIFGRVGGKPILAMAGRFHFYEGYTAQEVSFPIRVMKVLGVETVLISNAAGGLQPGLAIGDLMIIRDHISFATVNPLIGENDDKLGLRFPDMSEPYNKKLINKAIEIAGRHSIEVKEGIYFGVTGPSFETRAEYKLIRLIGGDAVGMSTVQEVIVANHSGMKVFAISVIADIGIREEENIITHEEVLAAAKNAEPKLTLLFCELIASI